MVKNTVHVVSLWYDCSSQPGAMINEIVGVYTSFVKAQKTCDKLNKKLTKELMEEFDCETEEDLEYVGAIEWNGFDLSSVPEYSIDSFPVK